VIPDPGAKNSASWCVTVKQHYSDCSVLYAHADHVCMAGDEVPNLANHLLPYYIPRILKRLANRSAFVCVRACVFVGLNERREGR
jgi:hypothetical protein